MIKKFDDIFSLLDTIQERDRRTDGRTDRQTDTGRQQRRLLHKASSNKSLAPQYNCIATLLCKVRTSAILQKITFSTHLTRNDKDVTVICFGCCQFWYLPIYILRNHIKFMPTSFSSTVHQHIALVKLSNCCVERIKVRLYFAGFLTSNNQSTQLTIRYGRPFRNVFTTQTPTALMN